MTTPTGKRTGPGTRPLLVRLPGEDLRSLALRANAEGKRGASAVAREAVLAYLAARGWYPTTPPLRPAPGPEEREARRRRARAYRHRYYARVTKPKRLARRLAKPTGGHDLSGG